MQRLHYMTFALFFLLGNALTCVLASLTPVQAFPDLYEASIGELQEGLDAGQFTSVDLVKAYFARIDEVNMKGATLRAVIELNPSALSLAADLDREREAKGKRSLLHGIPILLKDNIATIASEGMNTTAGSFSLLGSIVQDDAEVVKRLRKAGAIILGKANMWEWAGLAAGLSDSWSGRGGQCTSAFFPNADPCGSSSGSGVAASIGLATVTLGTETDGSITCPSSSNNAVGIKPTVGWTSRAGVVPLSEHQDTVGPITRSITDGAIVLSVIAGKDPNDNFTLAQPDTVPDFTQALKKDALKGKRIGVPRHVFLNNSLTGADPSIGIAFEQALQVIQGLGATVVDPADIATAKELLGNSEQEFFVIETDFKVQINQWFESLVENPSQVRNLADLIQFNADHPELEQPPQFTNQSMLIDAEATQGFNDTYLAALAFNKDIGSTRGVDATLQQYKLDALVLPALTLGFTPRIGALVGYPIVTVPLGFFPENVTIGNAGPDLVYPAPGVPFGLSFLGTAFSDFDLIGFGYAYEQATKTRLTRMAFKDAVPKTQLRDVISS